MFNLFIHIKSVTRNGNEIILIIMLSVVNKEYDFQVSLN